MFKILMVLIICFSACISQAQEECDQMIWCQNKQLQWSDFMGSPDSTVLVYETLPDAVSVIYTEIIIDSLNNYQALVKFDECKSWVRVRSEEILDHEIGHFNIEEILARQLQSVLDQNQENYDLNIDSLYSAFVLRSRGIHNLYDSKTLFGTRDDLQKIWTDSIESQLDVR